MLSVIRWPVCSGTRSWFGLPGNSGAGPRGTVVAGESTRCTLGRSGTSAGGLLGTIAGGGPLPTAVATPAVQRASTRKALKTIANVFRIVRYPFLVWC